MVLEPLKTSSPLLRRRCAGLQFKSYRKGMRSRRQSEHSYFVGCLLALAQSGGGASPSAAKLIPPDINSVAERQIQSSISTAQLPAPPIDAKLIPPDINSAERQIQLSSSSTAQSPAPPIDAKLVSPDIDSAAERKIQISSSTAQLPAPPVDSHRCSVCGKGFLSHQALGGHKASHRSRPSITDEEKPSTQISAPDSSGDYTSGPQGRHRCSTCGKSFQTGQALGGHMRKHFTGVIGKQGDRSKSGVNSSDGGNGSGAATSSSHRGCESHCTGDKNTGAKLDLNMTMDPELDLELKL